MLNLLLILILLSAPLLFFKHTVHKDASDEEINQQMKKSNRFVLLYILAFAMIAPYIMQYFPSSYSITSQIWVGIFVLLLDWSSLYQDKSRFSESKDCLFGNCRENAFITGVIAHIGDVLGVFLGIWAVVSQMNNFGKDKKAVFVLSTILYTVLGVYAIRSLTKKRVRERPPGQN